MASELLFMSIFTDSEDYSGDWRWQVSYCLWVYSVTQKITVVTGEWQVAGGEGWDVHGDLQMAGWVYMLTKYISNSQRIRDDSARMDWSTAVQASSVQVPKNWGLVWARSKNFSDWIGLDLDGRGPDCSIAGLVESLIIIPAQCMDFQFHLSDGATKAPTYPIGLTHYIVDRLESVIYGVTSNDQVEWVKVWCIRLIELESWWVQFGIQELEKTIKHYVILFGYPTMYVVCDLSESIQSVEPEDYFTSDISEWLYIICRGAVYQYTNTVD